MSKLSVDKKTNNSSRKQLESKQESIDQKTSKGNLHVLDTIDPIAGGESRETPHDETIGDQPIQSINENGRILSNQFESIKDQGESNVEPTLEETVEDKPWYGNKRMDVVDHVLEQIAEKERKNNINPVQLAALKAQEPYKTVSMSELGSSYQGPPKYLS